MPNHISAPAADLIKRMLQPDPLKRIKFSMIKNHPWLRDSDTMYMEIGQRNTRITFNNKIHEEVFNKLMKMDFNFHNMPPSVIRECILKKKYYSFVVGYDLMVNESIKAEIVATKSNSYRFSSDVDGTFQLLILDESKSQIPKRRSLTNLDSVFNTFETLQVHPEVVINHFLFKNLSNKH